MLWLLKKKYNTKKYEYLGEINDEIVVENIKLRRSNGRVKQEKKGKRQISS